MKKIISLPSGFSFNSDKSKLDFFLFEVNQAYKNFNHDQDLFEDELNSLVKIIFCGLQSVLKETELSENLSIMRILSKHLEKMPYLVQKSFELITSSFYNSKKQVAKKTALADFLKTDAENFKIYLTRSLLLPETTLCKDIFLYYSVKFNYFELFKFMRNQNANITVKDKEFNNLLHLSLKNSNSLFIHEVIKKIPENEINAKNKYEQTPLIILEYNYSLPSESKEKTKNMLLQKGADELYVKDYLIKKKLFNIFDLLPSNKNRIFDIAREDMGVSWLKETLHKFFYAIENTGAYNKIKSDLMLKIISILKTPYSLSAYNLDKEKNLIERINQGETILLIGGWEKHFVGFILNKKNLLICNVGQGAILLPNKNKSKAIVNIKKNFSEEEIKQIVTHLSNAKAQGFNDGKKMIYHELPSIIKNQDLPDDIFEKYLKNRQRSGNCYYKSIKIAVFGLIVLLLKTEFEYDRKKLNDLCLDLDFHEKNFEQQINFLAKKIEKEISLFAKKDTIQEYTKIQKELNPDYTKEKDVYLLNQPKFQKYVN